MLDRVVIDLHGVKSVAGATVQVCNHGIRLNTPPQQWAFAGQVQIELPLNYYYAYKIKVRLQVLSGALGIGWLGSDGREWIVRKLANRTDLPQIISLTVPFRAQGGCLIFDNWSEEGEGASAVIESIIAECDGRDVVYPVLTSNPRSGTHFLKALLARAMELAPLEVRLPDESSVVDALNQFGGRRLIYEHFQYSIHGQALNGEKWPGLRMIVLTRHPFDRLISQTNYEKALYGDHPVWSKPPHELAYDRLLGEWDGRSWVDGSFTEDFATAIINLYHDLVTDWVRHRGGLQVRYEDLVADPASTLGQCLKFLGGDGMSAEAREAVKSVNFQSLSGGRVPGDIDASSHYRRGLSGEWREVFSLDQQKRLVQKYGSFLEEVGYAD